MVEHMNQDHAKAIAHYVELSGLPADEPAQLVGIDSEGMHLRIGQGIHWLPFSQTCNTPTQVREALVQLARAEKWPDREAQEA
jgi:putative heme iron utilization protein